MSTVYGPEHGLNWYLAGPMTGLPKFNYPFFFRVAAAMRNAGWTVTSPAEMDTPGKLELVLASEDGKLDGMEHLVGTWADFLSEDVKLIADKIDGLVFLPGWQKSRGARLEAYVGLICGKPFMVVDSFQDELLLSDIGRDTVKAEVFKHV